jgi:hypothetical protein
VKQNIQKIRTVTQFNRKMVFFSVLGLFLSTHTPLLAEYRIATVDINKVLNETKESKEAR